MKKIAPFLFLAIMGGSVSAQHATLKDIQSAVTSATKTTDDTTKYKWRTGGTVNLNLTQASSSSWIAAGGEDFSLSFNGVLHAYASKKWDKTRWDNVLDVNYGLVNTTSLGLRKVNDLLNLLSKLDYAPSSWKKVSLSALAQLRSQLTSGYDYGYFGSTINRKNSNFFAPAYLTVSPGFDWRPASWISIFGSPLAGRLTLVAGDRYSFADPSGTFNGQRETPLATLYGVDSLTGRLWELGAFVTINVKVDIMKNITYIGKVDLYSDYLSHAQNVSLFSTNKIQMKVNKWINVNYEIDFLDDDNIKQAANPTHAVGLQVLSTLGVGFEAKF